MPLPSPFSLARTARATALGLVFAVFAAMSCAAEKTIDLLTNVSRGSLRGVLMPTETRQLSARAAGVIEKFGAEEGQHVKAGDLLVQLNSDVERAEVARAEAVLESANAEVERTKRELERATQLRNDSIGSKKDFEDAQHQYAMAAAGKKRALADLDLARAKLNERIIVAPIAGLVTRRTREIGEAVERLEQVVRIEDASRLELTVYGSAELLGKFKAGQKAGITLEDGAGRGTTIAGVVSYVDPTMDPTTATFRIKLEIQPDGNAQAGIPVTLQMPSEVN